MSIPNLTARFRLPDLIEKGLGGTVFCPVYWDGRLVAPDSGTWTFYDCNGDVIASGAATIVDSIATATITPANMSTTPLQERARIEWSLDFTQDGTPATYTRVFRNEASVVRVLLHPVITDNDLFRIHPDLSTYLRGGVCSYQDQIDEAWDEIRLRLYEQGNRSHLIATPTSFRSVHRDLSLAIIFEGFDQFGAADNDYRELADRYRDRFERGWDRLTFSYEACDQDGVISEYEEHQRAQRSVYLGWSPYSYPYGDWRTK